MRWVRVSRYPKILSWHSEGVSLHLDPFCAFYLQRGEVAYAVLESGEDGFMVNNAEQERYQGKFWRNDKQLIPPQSV